MHCVTRQRRVRDCVHPRSQSYRRAQKFLRTVARGARSCASLHVPPASPKTSSQGGPYTDDARTHQSLFDDEAQWVTGYDASYRNEYPLRVTVTLPFLRKVSFGVVYAVGKDKKNALIATLAPVGTISQTPARIIAEMPHCLLYTDQTLDTVK